MFGKPNRHTMDMPLEDRGDLLFSHAMQLESRGKHQEAGEVWMDASVIYRAASSYMEPLESRAAICIKHARRMAEYISLRRHFEAVLLALGGGYFFVRVLEFALRAQEVGMLAALGVR